MWLTDSGFMVMGLVSGWSLANHSNSESFLVAHARSAQPRWMLARGILGSGRTRGVSFHLSRTLPVGGGLLVPYSFSGSPVIKQLMQMVTMVPGQGGFNQCASPNKTTGVGSHFLLQGIFPTQRLNLSLLHLLHWQVDSLPLSHLRSPYSNPWRYT